MYSIACEILQPFGTDLNDLDLDRMADDIVSNILFVARNYRPGVGQLLNVDDANRPYPVEHSKKSKPRAASTQLGPIAKFLQTVRLAIYALPWRQMVLAMLWTCICVLAVVIVKEAPTSGILKVIRGLLSPDATIRNYASYALFLLLGFRLSDSHSRYSQGQDLWKDGIMFYLRLISNRIYQSYPDGTWHKGDLDRIADHLNAFAVVTACKLRREDPSERLSNFMTGKDVELISRTEQKSDYCLDVLYAYLVQSNSFGLEDAKRHPISGNEHFMVSNYLERLRKYAAECERLVTVPLPFGYRQHTKVFTGVWLVLLPLALAETYKWFTVPLVLVIAYGVLGIERWAEELADPFGYDLSDLPLDDYCQDISKVTMESVLNFTEGTNAVIRPERRAFPAI